MSALSDGPVAAADLGSNSFHLAVGEVRDGSLFLIDKLKERVALAAGLDDARTLDEDTQERAIACLERFGARIAGIPADRVRACGTNTLRAASNSTAFLRRAEEALGHPIDVIDGAEEARLVYRGVAWSDAPGDADRLVLDIGGGSTEVVMGAGVDVHVGHSLRMGCVTFSEGFFPGGGLSADRYQGARFAATLELRSIAAEVRAHGVAKALGASGTFNAIGEILRASELTDGSITPDGVAALLERVLDVDDIEALDLPGLSDNRRPVIVGGLAIADAAMRALGLESIRPVEGALREGVLAELAGDPGDERRERTVAHYQERLSVNRAHADRVRRVLDELAEKAEPGWSFGGLLPIARQAAALHEVGLFLRRAGYHKHGSYLIANSDLPGFSRRSQALLAAFVLSHRRKFRYEEIEAVARDPRDAVRLAALLRVAVRLCRPRVDEVTTPVEVHAEDDALHLVFDGADSDPLLLLDLEQERERLERAALKLTWEL